MTRPGWVEYFIGISRMVATRTTCMRRAVGAVIVKDRRILATGYNGAPSGVIHCEAVGCARQQQGIISGQRHELCRGLHAEQNAIIQAAYYGISIAQATLYCTTKPCIICAKMLINAGILHVVYEEGYDDPLADDLLNQAGIKIERYIP